MEYKLKKKNSLYRVGEKKATVHVDEVYSVNQPH